MRGATALEGDPRWAAVAWSALAEPGDPRACSWIAAHGPVESLARLRGGGLDEEGAYAARLAALDLGALAEATVNRGITVVLPTDDSWPRGLLDLAAPPHCLYLRGRADPGELFARSVAVVGARAATNYGVGVAAQLGADLAGAGWTVVSGGAYGIDAAAHRGALTVGGPTAAFLAGGLDKAYPAGHQSLFERIEDGGLLVSEAPLGRAPYASRFIARNRLIATVSQGTVVVEANLRSGSRNTAKLASDHHREVMAVPGPVTAATSAGCHELIRSGMAALVTDADDVRQLISPLGAIEPAPPRRAEPTAVGELDPATHRVWSALPVRTPVSLERLAVSVGEHPRAILLALGRLERAGLARNEGAGYCKRAART